MRFGKLLACTFVLSMLAPVATVHGESVFVTNPELPYPPGCAGDPGRSLVVSAEPRSFSVPDRLRGPAMTLHVTAYRATCSETGRSVIWLRFSAPDDMERPFVAEVPTVTAVLAHRDGPLMALAREAGTYSTEGDPQLARRYLAHMPSPGDGTDYGPWTNTESWDFVLDNAPGGARFPADPMTAEEYNGAFALRLEYPDETLLGEIGISALSDLFEAEPGIPISGRLEGLWVVEGARDQGVMISVANRVAAQDSPLLPREAQPLVLFLAHYTYHEDGAPLWLTGATSVAQGQHTASLALERVTGGQFMAAGEPERTVAGPVRLVANACNDLTLEYDYRALGLGEGAVRLQRLFSLETAGFDCRDYAARHEANR